MTHFKGALHTEHELHLLAFERKVVRTVCRARFNDLTRNKLYFYELLYTE